jgi:glutamine amidotransferase
LGILAGKVVRFKVPAGLKVPHMGWNKAHMVRRGPILEGLEEGVHFYFVHAYYVEPDDRENVAIETDYGGTFCSAVWRGTLFATQFHPEKSQAAGLRLLKNFAELPPLA